MQRLVSLLVPAITIVMGAAVAGIVASLMTGDAEPERSDQQLMRTQQGRSAGFTLLEVLIAFVIAGLAVAALMQAGASGLGATRVATRYEEAVARARSHLAAATHGGVLVAADNQGEDGGGFHWRLLVAPAATVLLRPQGAIQHPGAKLTLDDVSVWISWRDGDAVRDVRLDTKQIGEGGR